MTKKKIPSKKISLVRSKNKPSKKSTRRIKTKTVIASKTGVHNFDNAGILMLQEALFYAEVIERHASRGFSHRLYQILQNSHPTISTKLFLGTASRAITPGSKQTALDDKSTFAAGGRVNIGMSQQDALFKGKMAQAYGGIYCSQESSTAKIEYNSVVPGPVEIVYIRYKKTNIKLIDFDSIVNALDNLLAPESLSGRVYSAPFHGAWKYQKFPLASQLIGNWVRLHAGEADGLFFQSTKDPKAINFFIFHPENWTKC